MNEKRNGSRAGKRRLFRTVGSVFIGLALFGLGWAFGDGRISVRQYSATSNNKGLPEKLDFSSVETVYRSLRDNFDGELDETKLLEGLKAGLAKATGDPYTEYLNPEGAKEFTNDLKGTFEGIGAELGKDADDNLIIVTPIAGFTAERAGLHPRDIIAQINGETTTGLTISQAVDRIRGEKGTTVTLTIVRGTEIKDYEITRETIDIPSVKHEVKDGIGILTISRYGDDTVALAHEAARAFRAANVRGVILDLRSNPGGLLEAAVDVSSLWLDNGTTILTERRDNVVINTFRARGTALLKGMKTVVLINEGSASASEITAGALKDNEAATLIGQKSYGKGSVQRPINLRDGGLLKITTARWFTPAGKNIDREGIEPDEKVDYTDDDFKNDRDPQLDAALTKLKS